MSHLIFFLFSFLHVVNCHRPSPIVLLSISFLLHLSMQAFLHTATCMHHHGMGSNTTERSPPTDSIIPSPYGSGFWNRQWHDCETTLLHLCSFTWTIEPLRRQEQRATEEAVENSRS